MRRALAFVGLFAMCNFPIIIFSLAAWETGRMLAAVPLFFSEPILVVPLAASNLLFIVVLWTTLRRAEAP